ncbi:hypothetical protein AB205_0035030 [Aquarana catesbeiana]|uniref:Uncharacterized protein n=1 Tax=Aquarana catesbeiana TaxID=8400 RepID=A0A2G9NR40_AQUCT|nr:hypothetical protein AB205_0035030 [Aquarana catesbeiana]
MAKRNKKRNETKEKTWKVYWQEVKSYLVKHRAKLLFVVPLLIFGLVSCVLYFGWIQIQNERKEFLVERYQFMKDREQLLAERIQFTAVQNQSHVHQYKWQEIMLYERKELVGERKLFTKDWSHLLKERDQLLNERLRLGKQRDQLLDERNQLKEERDQLLYDREQLRMERDQIMIKGNELVQVLKELQEIMKEGMQQKRGSNRDDGNSYFDYFTKALSILEYAAPLTKFFF